MLIKSGPDFKRMCNFIEDPAQRLHTTFIDYVDLELDE